MYALAYGDLIDGLAFVGPFTDREEAIRYMDEERETRCFRTGITLVFLNVPCWASDEGCGYQIVEVEQ